MVYLKSALLATVSKPKILFQAMGVDTTPSSSLSSRINTQQPPSPTDNPNHNAPSFWEMEENEMGIRIQIPKFSSPSNRTIIDNSRSAFGGSPVPSRKKASSEGATNSRLPDDGDHHEASTNPVGNERFQLNYRSQHRLSSAPTIVQRPTAASNRKQPVATSPVTHSSEQGQSSHLHHHHRQQLIPLSIICKVCGTEGPEGSARAYVQGPSPLSIVLCSNRLPTQDDISEVLTHELIHVYDVHSRKWDLTDCNTLAKSEVRAAREAECADASLNFTKRYCVKNKARVATTNMFPGERGRNCVGKVFEEAMGDNVPFEKHYNKHDNSGSSMERGEGGQRGSHSHGSSG